MSSSLSLSRNNNNNNHRNNNRCQKWRAVLARRISRAGELREKYWQHSWPAVSQLKRFFVLARPNRDSIEALQTVRTEQVNFFD